jgi:AraC-like DNA-binding protein
MAPSSGRAEDPLAEALQFLRMSGCSGPAMSLIPHGEGHRLYSAAGAPTPMILELPREHVSTRYEILRHGDGGEATTLVCGPVMRYITRRRMRVAVDSLAANGSTVGELASRLGYQSEAAFGRAFKRNVGQWPGAVRRSGIAFDPS